MSDSDFLVFTICLLALSFLAGAMEAIKGLSFKRKLLCWLMYAVLAATPVFLLMQVLPDGTNTITIYSSSDEENSLVGPLSAFVITGSVIAVVWCGKQVGKALRTKLLGDDLA